MAEVFSWEKLTQTLWSEENETKSKEEMKEGEREMVPAPHLAPVRGCGEVLGSWECVFQFPPEPPCNSLGCCVHQATSALCCFTFSFPFLLAEHRQECQKEFVSTREVRCSLSASRPKQDYFSSCLVVRKSRAYLGPINPSEKNVVSQNWTKIKA